MFYGASLYTLVLIGLEIALKTWRLEIIPVTEYGVLRYTSAEPDSGPPLMVLLVTLVMLIAAFAIWRKSGWIWMLAGIVIRIIGSAVSVPVDSSAVTNAFELILLFYLLWMKIHLEQKNKEST